jgi:hypothetical protein
VRILKQAMAEKLTEVAAAALRKPTTNATTADEESFSL